MTIRTYVDANILITAFRGGDADADAAVQLLAQADRSFVASEFLRLETLRKPMFYRRVQELEFLQTFFSGVQEWVSATDGLLQQALELAAQHDLGAMDALHLAAAISAKVDEFVTLEKPVKPMFKVVEIDMVSLYRHAGD